MLILSSDCDEHVIVAAMLNMERGDGIQIDVPNVTKSGKVYKVQYKPTVGILYYTLSDINQLQPFIDKIISTLTECGTDHLTHKSIIVSATPNTTTTLDNFVSGETIVIGEISKFKKNNNLVAPIPARAFVWSRRMYH